jgi:hypothetical protein
MIPKTSDAIAKPFVPSEGNGADAR